MSLNCLTCSYVLQRTDSFSEMLPENEYRGGASKKVDRTWSGNMPASNGELLEGGAVAKIKANHRRVHSTGSSEPRLVRSSGMRRDWSFDNLIEKQDQGVSCH